ncbi:MAG: PTS glucose transporter subunit IIA, partial [Holdemania massiliensis]
SRIFSPVDGKIIMFFETKHALGIRAEDGAELLLHIGIDTVELNGKPFKERVKIGDSVSRGDLLLEVDFPMIKKSGYDTTVMLIATNRKIQLIKDTGQISMYEPVFRLL